MEVKKKFTNTQYLTTKGYNFEIFPSLYLLLH